MNNTDLYYLTCDNLYLFTNNWISDNFPPLPIDYVSNVQHLNLFTGINHNTNENSSTNGYSSTNESSTNENRSSTNELHSINEHIHSENIYSDFYDCDFEDCENHPDYDEKRLLAINDSDNDSDSDSSTDNNEDEWGIV